MTKKEPTDNAIHIQGARVHNLKGVSVSIPRNKLVVVCGVSGSGKSSLAFDTLYEEGQRRYLEGLSSYVRQFLGGFKKPDVEKIIGLSPTLAINQKSVSSNPRSTVGTITEIYDHLRLLFARAGTPICPVDNIPIKAQTPQEIADQIIAQAQHERVMITAPVVKGKKGEHKAVIKEVQQSGYTRLWVDGALVSSEEAIDKEMDKNKRHTIEVVVGEFDMRVQSDIRKASLSKAEKEALKKREKKLKEALKEERVVVLESVRKALQMGNGHITLYVVARDRRAVPVKKEFSEHYACPECGFSLPAIEPRSFSFNSPFGACETCQGLGTRLEIDLDLIVSPDLSLEAGAIKPWFSLSHMAKRALGANWQRFVTDTIVRMYNHSPKTPFGQLSPEAQRHILYGDKEKEVSLEDGDWKGKTKFEGVLPRLERLYYETDSEFIRGELSKYMREKTCPACEGARIKKDHLAVRISGNSIVDITRMSAETLLAFLKNEIMNGMSPNQKEIAAPIVREIVTKVKFLVDVGLEYMTVGRSATTLSVGENQRIRLATHLSSGLSGVIYVLDEPTIGLHARDTHRLVNTLKELRDLNNTVVVVEHDEAVIEAADWVIEVGPRAGEKGGHITFEGTPSQLKRSTTLTGQYLSGKKTAQSGLAKNTRDSEEQITLSGASEFNLNDVELVVPLRKMVAVAGVSGSGKSTLVLDVFAKAMQKAMGQAVSPGAFQHLVGQEQVNKVSMIDQSPIGRTPRSNPATYTGVLTPIRELFTRLEESQLRGYTPAHFSFNVKPGRCEACRGEGYKKVEMYFLPDIYVECEVCRGKRFSPEVLDVLYKGKSIADVLDMPVEEAHELFSAFPQIEQKLKVLKDIGLGYMKLGQPATTLSGGEAQRIKLADELSKRATGNTLYVLDEPTVGLHFHDVSRLLYILRALVQKGNTVLVIEHNLDVLKEADWIIEMGPEGGDKGGRIVAQGIREDIIKAKTATGKYLKK